MSLWRDIQLSETIKEQEKFCQDFISGLFIASKIPFRDKQNGATDYTPGPNDASWPKS